MTLVQTSKNKNISNVVLFLLPETNATRQDANDSGSLTVVKLVNDRSRGMLSSNMFSVHF